MLCECKRGGSNNFSDPKRASEAGKKGGEHSHGTLQKSGAGVPKVRRAVHAAVPVTSRTIVKKRARPVKKTARTLTTQSSSTLSGAVTPALLIARGGLARCAGGTV
jgi:hypothetical protein